MNENQRKAIQKLRPILIGTLQIDEVLVKLRADGILTADSTEIIKKNETRSERCIKLLDIIVNLSNSWIPFLNALDEVNQHHLRLELESEKKGIPSDEFKQNLVPQLEDYIKYEAEHIRRFWQDYLEVIDLTDVYQPLEIAEIKGQNVQKQTVEGFSFIFENSSRHMFVIEGDPGVGKTTWMSKLALDWTNTNEAIRAKFDLLYLIPLRYLESATFESLLEYLSNILDEIDIRKIAHCLKQPRTLLLLDGFDENPSCIEFIKTLTVKNGYRSKVVITCRGSHFDQIRKESICDMRLIVKGFKEEAMIRFFQLQNCENSNELFASYSQLPEMCKVPMIAAILCSICKHDDVSKTIAEDENCSLFIIFDNFVAMLINVAKQKRPGLINETNDAIKAAGIVALATIPLNRNN